MSKINLIVDCTNSTECFSKNGFWRSFHNPFFPDPIHFNFWGTTIVYSAHLCYALNSNVSNPQGLSSWSELWRPFQCPVDQQLLHAIVEKKTRGPHAYVATFPFLTQTGSLISKLCYEMFYINKLYSLALRSSQKML